ncbi:AMP-binding protein [Microvirga sp. W0021]|uniref:AMP-binding protein n=1 Tax=Hohaiivirga grylli TaxID=3133970 RepID=A0ABV0BN27_9HYPH
MQPNDEHYSYVKGKTEPPLLDLTIGQALDNIAERYPDRLALIVRDKDVCWTWAELKARVDAVAAGLLELGLKHGDRVGIWAPNCPEWALTQFATAKAGLILVSINPAYRASELEYALNKVECAALITIPAFKGTNFLDMLHEIGAEQLPTLKHIFTTGSQQYEGSTPFHKLYSDKINILNDIQIYPDDPVNIQFTSGTTGAPKGATLSHRNILNNGYFVGRCIRLGVDDKLCIPVPLYHCFGMVMSNLACVTSGAAMVYPGESFDALAVLQTVEAERCTALQGVPTMFIAELNHPQFNDFDLSSLRTGIMAGANCPITVMKSVMERMHMKDITIAYGMTETSPVSFQSEVDTPIEQRVSTVGRIQPHLEVKIIDDSGEIVPRGKRGEICTRGYSVMLGYWGDKKRTEEAIDHEGWMHTGDLGEIDQEGYCRIVGRLKDMVIRGGENIYPREIEEYLLTHSEIIEAQVFGIPDEQYGEELVAWIRLKEGARTRPEDIPEFCRGQIAHFKIPRIIRIVDEFPMTVTGKIRKVEMRSMMITEINAKTAGKSYI